MKIDMSHVDIGAMNRAENRNEKRKATATLLTTILLLVIFSSYLTYDFLNPSKDQAASLESAKLKAALVDQLSLTFPNETFVDITKSILSKEGYFTDHYSGREVTVELYRNLPNHYYDIIILRVHSVMTVYRGEPIVALFTSQLHTDAEFVHERSTGQVGKVKYSADCQEAYFGISQEFVRFSMTGEFAGALIILMGCEGIKDNEMAKAFVEKGAKTCIGWNGKVSAPHTDQTTTLLLQYLFTEKQPLEQAIENAMKEVGSDPAYGSTLVKYPNET